MRSSGRIQFLAVQQRGRGPGGSTPEHRSGFRSIFRRHRPVDVGDAERRRIVRFRGTGEGYVDEIRRFRDVQRYRDDLLARTDDEHRRHSPGPDVRRFGPLLRFRVVRRLFEIFFGRDFFRSRNAFRKLSEPSRAKRPPGKSTDQPVWRGEIRNG